MRIIDIEKILKVVPQTYGEARQRYPWIEHFCKNHEWDNRTTAENLVWLIDKLETDNNPQCSNIIIDEARELAAMIDIEDDYEDDNVICHRLSHDMIESLIIDYGNKVAGLRKVINQE